MKKDSNANKTESMPLKDFKAEATTPSVRTDTSCKGSKVIYLNKNGLDEQREVANQYLKAGQTYTVDYAKIESSMTFLYLEEVKGMAFNSAMFKEKHTKTASIDLYLQEP